MPAGSAICLRRGGVARRWLGLRQESGRRQVRRCSDGRWCTSVVPEATCLAGPRQRAVGRLDTRTRPRAGARSWGGS